ncbi:MAG: 3-dehydroquinate synthase, partial [Firmicutes bacterium]|nr:3-dehydroquinate synthase [Bacillota bacterium]
SDENVFPLYGTNVASALDDAGFAVIPVVIPAGEGSKTLAQADSLYTTAIEAGLDRSSVVVALGGGVVGDLAGFIAATYLRGVPFVQIPTTLLAQVDSSVGGKVAVNHTLGKNLIGSFYQPKMVWIELGMLQTLPQREFLAGAAEVVKYGAIMSESLLLLLENRWSDFLAQDSAVLTEVIASCCRLKAQVVVEDEREEGLRAILNFGHTLGHALEVATAYSHYLHGEAVLAGMVLAVHLAMRLSVLTPNAAARLLALFARVGLKRAPATLTVAPILAALQQDKKRVGETLLFVLPVAMAQVRSFTDVPQSLVASIVTEYLQGQEGSLLAVAN